jgi:hypothetical protein
MAQVTRAPLALFPLWLAFQQPSDPVVVKIIEPEKSELTTLADVLLGSLGLTGVLVLASIVAAGVFAGILFWFRSRD